MGRKMSGIPTVLCRVPLSSRGKDSPLSSFRGHSSLHDTNLKIQGKQQHIKQHKVMEKEV